MLKFLDIRNFFDTMNYKSALIEAYKSGVSGKYWRLYRNLNAEKTCTPCTPLGECGEISVDEVFVQGSSDAMLMAWNLVDSYNKRNIIMIDPVCCTEGVEIPRLGFVDDLLEFSRSIFETQVSCVSNEVFQNQHRITWKPVKCKILPMNIKIEDDKIELNNEKLEIVREHKYLGTQVSDKGRVSDLRKRINESKGVLNEIVEICKCEAVGPFRFPYMMTLINTCFKKKFQHGCEVWDSMMVKDREQVNRLIPQAVKRVLELLRSTPADAIRHNFGLINLENEVEMEKIILTARTLEADEMRIAKQLLIPMLEKKVPGYCSHVIELIEKYNISFDELGGVKDLREFVKSKVIEYTKGELLLSLLKGSKCDSITLNFCYNGDVLPYLSELEYEQSRIIFMFRSRMFPTRVNFPERWANNLLCVYCNNLDTDVHLLSCWGYMDITGESAVIDPYIFYTLKSDKSELSRGAKILLRIHKRLTIVQDDKDFHHNEE